MKKKITLAVLITLIAFSIGKAVLAQSVREGAMVTFRFDDGLYSQYRYARPILAQYGFSATAYVFTDPLQEGNWIGYMKWSMVKELESVYGWEIGGHTKSHPDLTKLSDSALIEELAGSKKIFESRGFAVKSFAVPFGLYNNRVLSYISQFYESNGSAWPYGFNSRPYDRYAITVQEVRGTTPVKTVMGWIDTAASEGKWLVLLFHNLVSSNPSEYEYHRSNFRAIVEYVNKKGIPVVNISEALASDVFIPPPPPPPPPPPNPNPGNLVLNPSFESSTAGWADKWIRNDSSHIILDSSSKGVIPNPINSLKITGGSATYSVRTEDFINIAPGKKYLLKVYFNCPSFSSGGIDIFMDEYGSNGNWLNWKWQTGIWSFYRGYKEVAYIPSSNAGKLLIWIEAVSSSNLTCYIDDIVLTEF